MVRLYPDEASLKNKSYDYALCIITDREPAIKTVKEGKNVKKDINLRQSQRFCLYPCFIFRRLLEFKFRSIIVTAECLTPFSGVENELRIPFPIKHEGQAYGTDYSNRNLSKSPSIKTNSQMMVGVL